MQPMSQDAGGVKKQSNKSKAFRLSKKDLLTVTEHAPDVICRFDPSFRLLYVNPAIEVATGIPPQAFKNKTTRELGMPEEHSAHWEKHISQVVATGQDTTMEFPFLTPARGVRYFHAVLVPEFADDGAVETVLTISRDITEKKELDKQSKDSVSVVSHELRTPITSLKIAAQFLQKKFAEKGDETTAEQLEKMNRQIDKMKNIIADLMDTTQIEHGTIKLQKDKFDFNLLVQEIVDEIKVTTGRKIRIKGAAASTVYADAFRIGQVITNLLSNAARYSPEGKEIHVLISSDATSVTCRVRDFGPGISSEQQQKIFERFYRANEMEHLTHIGLGLGLYISSEIIKLHNGKIWVESRAGKGSTFSFMLPLG